MTQWTPPQIVAPSATTQADRSLFERLGICQTSASPDAWVLHRVCGQLALLRPDGVTLEVDFTAGKARHRTQESGFGAQTLAKALGIKQYLRKHQRWPLIMDANGGLGQDTWAIASTGCEVCVLEQHPVIHALLDDALQRAGECKDTQAIANRVSLHKTDSIDYLNDTTISAHAVYLDPMYPPRERKKAQSKKAAQFLHALAGPAAPDTSRALLQAALATQTKRVVVKRPQNAPRLEGSNQFKGQITAVESRHTRYDIYHLPTVQY